MSSDDRPVSLLVLGLGNVLCADDGVGVAALGRLAAAYRPPDGGLFLDGGTLGLALLPYLEDARDVILLDAVRADGPPGTLVRLAGADVPPAVRERLSPHQIGVADLLDGARLRGRTPNRLSLLGVVPESLDLRVSLSPSVAAALPGLVAAAVEESAAWSYGLEPVIPHASRPIDLDDPLRRCAVGV